MLGLLNVSLLPSGSLNINGILNCHLQLIDEMVEVLKNEVNTTNTFLLAFKGTDERMDDKIQQMVSDAST